MYKVNSQTLTEDGKSSLVPLKRWRFNLANGNTGTLTVSDVLLDTEESARERALSEFLRNGYQLKVVRFSTYRTDFKKNSTIKIQGLNYLVKDIAIAVIDKSLVAKVRAVRYE